MNQYRAVILLRLEEGSLEDAAKVARAVAEQVCDESFTDCARVVAVVEVPS